MISTRLTFWLTRRVGLSSRPGVVKTIGFNVCFTLVGSTDRLATAPGNDPGKCPRGCF